MGFFSSILSGFKSFLGSKTGQFISGAVKNIGKEAITSLGNSLRNGSDPIASMKSVGKTAAHSLGGQLLNHTFDSVRDFASNRLEQSLPDFVKPFESGAEKFKKRLNDGYSNLLGNGGKSKPAVSKMEDINPYPTGGSLVKGG